MKYILQFLSANALYTVFMHLTFATIDLSWVLVSTSRRKVISVISAVSVKFVELGHNVVENSGVTS